MFNQSEDQKSNPGGQDAKDMFEGVPDNAPVRPQVPGPLPKNTLLEEEFEGEQQSGIFNKRTYIMVGVGVVLIIAIGVGVQYFFSRKNVSATPNVPADMAPAVNTDTLGQEQQIATPPVDNSTNQPVIPPASEQVVQPALLDSDGDGLTDEDELKNYHTNPFQSDSDVDELSDREEVQVYKTDPNKNDSDGDTFLDGKEVQNGYNPNGTGKLLVIPGIDSSSSTQEPETQQVQ